MSEIDSKVVAVGYEDGDMAPVILAKGKGEKAKRILDIAADFGLVVKKDEDLLRLMDALEVGTYIPEKLFQTFAVILAEIYKVNGNLVKERVDE